MQKRVLCLMLACCVFCSSVITNKKDAYAVAGVDDAFVFALAGAMVVGAGYVAYQESDSIMETGRAMCQKSAEMYGKRGNNGQVKVYDKAKELGLKNKVLTRWEGHFTFEHLI